MTTRLLTPTLLLLGLSACAPSDGGQVGEENLGCLPVSTTELGEGDQSPLGFAPSEVLAFAAAAHSAPIQWADDTTNQLTATLSLAGGIRYEEREFKSDDSGGIEPALEEETGCLDVIVFEMTLALESEDGRLAESLSVELEASTAELATVSSSLELLTGSLDIVAFAPEGDFDDYRAFMTLALDATGLTGSIDGQASGEDGDIAFAQGYEIALIGDAPN